MTIRWRRDKPYSALQRAASGIRLLRLQDSETDITYMKIESRFVGPGQRAWFYIICTPPDIVNKVSAQGWLTEDEAKEHAIAWWKQNGESHLKDWKQWKTT